MTPRTHDDTQAGARRLGRLVVGILLVAALTLAGPSAWAYWTSSGDGTGSATTATLNPPAGVFATFTPGLTSVGVSWQAPTAGVTPLGYYVTRTRTSDGVPAAACASDPTALVTGLMCPDAATTGTYNYTVTAVYRSWTATSGSSNTVSVVTDTTAPLVTVTRVNGAVGTFPFATTGNVTSFGGACGVASGDVGSVTVQVNGTSAGAVPCVSGAWTLPVSWTTEGTWMVSAMQADAAGNVGSTPQVTIAVDRTGPTLLSIDRAGPSSVNSGPLLWTVTFSEPVSALATSNFRLIRSGVSGTTTISGVSASGGSPSATWTVSVSAPGVTGTDAGSIGLELRRRGAVIDAAGNPLLTNTFMGQAYIYDTTRPTVAVIGGVSSTLDDGQYRAGQLVPVTVAFSEAVTVAGPGTPRLILATGTTATTAVAHTPGPVGPELTFRYTVAPGDTSIDLDYASTAALELNGGAITDAAGNVAILTLPNPGATGSLGANKALVVDTAAPTVVGVSSSSSNASYRAGQAVAVTVTLSEAVTVSGTPQLALATGTPGTNAGYTSGSGTTVLTFTYTVAAGNTSGDLDYESVAALALNGGTIKDPAGNNASLALAAPGAAGSLGAAKDLVIDTTRPGVTVTHVNGFEQTFPYTTGANLASIGGTCGTASGDAATVAPRINGAATAPVNATCQPGGTWSLTLTTQQSTTGTRTLSATQGDLAGNIGTAPNQTIVLDKTPPTVSSIAREGGSQLVNAGPLVWTVTFSEPVTGVAAGNFGLVAGGLTGTPTISGLAAVGPLPSATWTISSGMGGIDGSNAGSIGLNLTGIGSIVDAVGNQLGTTTFTGQAYTYDTARPTVTGVSSALANGSYRAGQVVPVTVTFSEPVNVTGTPRLTLSTGPSATTAVDYASGSGGTTLTFEYTVEPGHTSADLDYAATTALALNGGAISDAAGNTAVLTLPAPGAVGSLGGTKALVIDTTPPVVTVTGMTSQIPGFFITRVRASGVAEVGAGPVTVYLCSTAVPVCDSNNRTVLFADVAVSVSGTWQTGWSPWAGPGTWIAGATQTDAAGNVGTSSVFGPFSS